MYGIFTYICLFLMVKYGFHVGKYTSPMDSMGTTEIPPPEIRANEMGLLTTCLSLKARLLNSPISGGVFL